MIHFSEITPQDLLNSKYKLSDIKTLTNADMPTTFTKGFNYTLPGWYIFILAYLTGSAMNALRYLRTTGVKTKRGGDFSHMAVLFAMWNWVFLNLKDAELFFVDEENNFAVEDFHDMVVEKAAKLKKFDMSDDRLKDFLINNNLATGMRLERIKEHRPEVYRYFKTEHPEFIQK